MCDVSPRSPHVCRGRGPRVVRTVMPLALLLVIAAAAACERRDADVDEGPEPLLTLAVETPEALDWGGSGTLRVTLANEGEVIAGGGLVEVYVPSWLEFGAVEPAGTEVMVMSGDVETRLTYSFADSIPPGDRRTVVQHLRVRYAPPAATVPRDTIETVQMAPANQVVRARLLNAAGEPAGAEVQATLQFVGAAGPMTPPRTDTTARRDTVPPDTVPPDTVPPADTLAARRPTSPTGAVDPARVIARRSPRVPSP